MNFEDRYDDIINLPYPISATRQRMSMHDRAAQFSPFAALVGYDDCVGEAARLTDSKLELTEDQADDLNEKLQILTEYADFQPMIAVEYFVPDPKKSGGAYITVTGNFRRIDEYNQKLVLTSGSNVPLSDIYRIYGEIFK